MNYLKQIIAFDKWEELHPLTDKAYRLWSVSYTHLTLPTT